MSQEQEQVHAPQKANVPFRGEKASPNGTVQAQEITLPSKWAVLAILAIGIFMSTLDSSLSTSAFQLLQAILVCPSTARSSG